MPDTAVIVTGLVGAAGIAGTLLSARITARSDMAGLKLSIAAEDKRAQLAEKRRIYAGFLAPIDKLINAYEPVTEAGPDERQELRAAASAAMQEVWVSLGEVRLIAPEPVGRQADSLVTALTAYDTAVFSNDHDAEAAPWLEIFRQRSALYEAMRADLGTGQAPAG